MSRLEILTEEDLFAPLERTEHVLLEEDWKTRTLSVTVTAFMDCFNLGI